MLCKEGSNDHAATIVHPAAVVELAHGRINDWVACLAFTPGFEMLLVVFPGYVGVFRFEWFVHARSRQLQVKHEGSLRLTRQMANWPERVCKSPAMQLH